MPGGKRDTNVLHYVYAFLALKRIIFLPERRLPLQEASEDEKFRRQESGFS